MLPRPVRSPGTTKREPRNSPSATHRCASLDGNAQTWFVLKDALLQDAFHEQPGIGDLELRTRLHGKFGDDFPVCYEAIVQHEARTRNRVLVARMREIEVPQLDFTFLWI